LSCYFDEDIRSINVIPAEQGRQPFALIRLYRAPLEFVPPSEFSSSVITDEQLRGGIETLKVRIEM
jgi:hypothetical protein